jgi:NDP-sugar pyrophosphorylase family protein
MTTNYVSVGPDIDRTAVLDLMKARSIRHIPIVDSKKKLIGAHFLEDLIGSDIKANIAVIIAGGKGTRLLPLTEDRPKPMILVAGRPILERIVLHLVGYGIRKIYISINYLGEQIEKYFGNGESFGCSIEYLREEKPLGTGGALSLLTIRPDKPFIVMNGDIVTQINLSSLLDFHEKQGVAATIGCRPHKVDIPFGVIREKGNRLVSIDEKPSAHYLVNAGVYVLNAALLDMVPGGENFPITGLFEWLLERKIGVGVYIIEEDWVDVGRHEELKRANGSY